ncbi:MAG TPA: acyltransferase [Mycobacteriales bacterium]|nr:acyltransferase [Mycobacteriales bacterium]
MTYRRLLRILLAPFMPVSGPIRRLRQRLARERLIVRLKLLAQSVGATIDVRIARDVRIDGPGTLEIYPSTANTLVIGSGVVIGDGVRLSLRGGSLEIGDNTEVRRLGTYQITGQARIGSGVVLSNGITLHCAETIEIDDLTIIGEYTTITDSSHVRTDAGVPIHHASATRPVRIGSNIWIGAHAVITPGVEIGDQAFVGAGAVVTKNVEPWWLVAGVPARPISKLEPPAG